MWLSRCAQNKLSSRACSIASIEENEQPPLQDGCLYGHPLMLRGLSHNLSVIGHHDCLIFDFQLLCTGLFQFKLYQPDTSFQVNPQGHI